MAHIIKEAEAQALIELESLRLLREIGRTLLKDLDDEGRELLQQGLDGVENHIMSKFNKVCSQVLEG